MGAGTLSCLQACEVQVSSALSSYAYYSFKDSGGFLRGHCPGGEAPAHVKSLREKCCLLSSVCAMMGKWVLINLPLSSIVVGSR